MARRLFLLIPVLNEAANLPRLMADIDAHADRLAAETRAGCPRVVLLDDGSTDGTATAAAAHAGRLPLEVLRHEVNKGPGRAFATGFAWLRSRLSPDDLVITLEGDNTSRLETAVKMAVRQREGYDVVLASPYAYGGGFRETTLLRLILSQGANGFVKGFLGLNGLHTTSSFFRLFTGAVLLKAQRVYGPGIIERAGFEGVVEMLMKLTTLKAAVSEVEMLLDSSRRAGKSKMKVGRTVRGYFALARSRGRWAKAADAYLVHNPPGGARNAA